ncbi:hypothetical protein CLOP_g10690 [Closterium sp. NIES-67]|nr:hypothetical protein CLOP_g10690 [Closterium sp. NIES-67]
MLGRGRGRRRGGGRRRRWAVGDVAKIWQPIIGHITALECICLFLSVQCCRSCPHGYADGPNASHGSTIVSQISSSASTSRVSRSIHGNSRPASPHDPSAGYSRMGTYPASHAQDAYAYGNGPADMGGGEYYGGGGGQMDMMGGGMGGGVGGGGVAGPGGNMARNGRYPMDSGGYSVH